MLKRTLFIFGMLTFFMAVAYAQIAPPSILGMRKELPAVQDPAEEKIMVLSQVDAELVQKAQEYINQGKTDSAIIELEKISDPWASHWLLSYLYESNVQYKDALREVSWLVSSCERRDLVTQLEHRKDALEETIRNMEQWEDRWDTDPRDKLEPNPRDKWEMDVDPRDQKKLIFE